MRARKWQFLPIIVGIICLSGCSLFRPKDKEFFQKKVIDVPEKITPAYSETQRQGLQYVKYNVDQAYVAALQEQASTNVTQPLTNAITVIDPLIVQAGPPIKAYQGDPVKLAQWINKTASDYNKAIDKYTDKIEPLVGKKIEGTGWIQMGYFTWIGFLLFGLFLLYAVTKIVLSIWFPAISVGARSVSNLTSSAVSKALSQVISGGEAFKTMLDDHLDDQATIDKVKELFKIAQNSKQDQHVQDTIKVLTVK